MPMGPPETLTGVWHGLYSYPAELEPVYFVATLIETASALHGRTREATVGRSGAPLTAEATLEGRREGGYVGFSKAYDSGAGFGHAITYRGVLSADGTEIEGEWAIPGDWSGRFLMIRDAGATERTVRRAFERT
jgi:hypothetical protein